MSQKFNYTKVLVKESYEWENVRLTNRPMSTVSRWVDGLTSPSLRGDPGNLRIRHRFEYTLLYKPPQIWIDYALNCIFLFTYPVVRGSMVLLSRPSE